MGPREEITVVEDALNTLSKEDLVRLLVEKLHTGSDDHIPITVFTTDLSPLEALTRYLKENSNKRINQIAKILHKQPASISEAYRNSQDRPFKVKKCDIMIPLSEFEKNSDLSVLEIVVMHLKKRDLRFTEIGDILGRDSRTIWTLHKRAESKSNSSPKASAAGSSRRPTERSGKKPGKISEKRLKRDTSPSEPKVKPKVKPVKTKNKPKRAKSSSEPKVKPLKRKRLDIRDYV